MALLQNARICAESPMTWWRFYIVSTIDPCLDLGPYKIITSESFL